MDLDVANVLPGFHQLSVLLLSFDELVFCFILLALVASLLLTYRANSLSTRTESFRWHITPEKNV
jgi:hypothetical protein